MSIDSYWYNCYSTFWGCLSNLVIKEGNNEVNRYCSQGDELGRVVIPIELRRTLGIEEKTLEIYVDGEKIILKKYEPACIFCGNAGA